MVTRALVGFLYQVVRFKRAKDGVTAVEFALIAVPLFMIIFAIVELGLLFFAEQALNNATMNAARMIRTGQAQTMNIGADDFRNMICDGTAGLLCSKPEQLHIDVRTYDSFAKISETPPLIDPDDKTFTPPSNFQMGSSSSVVMVRVIYEWPMLTNWMKDAFQDTADGDRLLVSTVIFKNEPF
ncbi:pilus assembly protein [Pseudovibrio exalbescens]|uniref:TadE/TadG family type IV pilus assembly protein n=1 Tax=Pseudovibrio exalbescens TaxID=197461 RepID=UPI002366150F|nr:TadE/TadG family type IV pilus assembly protein [Pseudovibrio exalbescens]MDD7910100.1 pilus assembly protein [Pseudovibrio exalbescens]